MKIPSWVVRIGKFVGIEIVVRFADALLDSDAVVRSVASAMFRFGKWVTTNCRNLIGDRWEDFESELQKLMKVAETSFHAGLDSDDTED